MTTEAPYWEDISIDIEICYSLLRFGASATLVLPKLRKIAENELPDYRRSAWAKIAIQNIEKP